jgi:hypothetical protein
VAVWVSFAVHKAALVKMPSIARARTVRRSRFAITRPNFGTQSDRFVGDVEAAFCDEILDVSA